MIETSGLLSGLMLDARDRTISRLRAVGIIECRRFFGVMRDARDRTISRLRADGVIKCLTFLTIFRNQIGKGSLR